MSSNTANEKLQSRLREMIDNDGLTKVSAELAIGREALARYLANLPMHTSTFRGIEATIEAAGSASRSARGR